MSSSLSLPTRVVVSLRAGAVLALANILCVVIFSWAWVHVRAEPKSISVTGSARKEIVSDLIVWTVEVTASDPDLRTAYTALNTSLHKTVDYLKAKGITDDQMKVGYIETTRHFERDAKGNDTDKITSFELRQGIEVTSTDVTGVAAVSCSVTDLIQDGVMLSSDSPRFLYTHIADLKIAMLAEATKDATTRAQQIATNSNAALGPIIDARMGVMQINALHDDDATGSGVNDTTSLQKEITAVVSAHFSLQ